VFLPRKRISLADKLIQLTPEVCYLILFIPNLIVFMLGKAGLDRFDLLFQPGDGSQLLFLLFSILFVELL
jgi:hypothetical protein